MLKTNSLESHIDIFKATDVNIKNVVFKYKTVLIFSIYFLALLKSEKKFVAYQFSIRLFLIE